MPEEFQGSLNRVANDNWKLVEGSSTDPYGTISDSDGGRYFWMVSSVDVPITSSDTLTFFMTPFKNGITNDETPFNYSVTMVNLNNNKNVSVKQDSSFIADVNKFNWNNATHEVTGSNQTATHYVGEPLQDLEITNPITFKLTTTPNPNNVNYDTSSNVFGTSFAKAVNFKSTYQLPMGTTDTTCPLIKVDESMFTDSNGTPLSSDVLTLIRNAQNEVTGFTINATIENSDLNKQLSNASFLFKINNAKMNTSCSDLADLPSGSSKQFSITQTSYEHQVIPSTTLDSSANLNTNGNRTISQSAMPALNFTYRVAYKETPLDSYKDTVKGIVSIAGKSTAQMSKPFTAYPDDTVVYETGAEHIKNLNTSNISLKYEEVAGVDFNPNQIIPTQITTGTATVSGKWNITITYKDGTASVVKNNLANNSTFAISNGANIDKITTTIDLLPGNEITKGQYTSFKVVDQKDLSKEGLSINNTVNQTYTNDTTIKSSSSTIDFNYKLKPFNKAGLFESDKKGINLAGATEKTTPKSKDVIEFMIFLKNTEGANFEVDQVIDHFTTDSLTPYNGTTTTTDGTTQIDSKLLNNTNNLNLVLWNGDPSNAASTPIAFPGGNPDITINNGLIDIKFKDKISVPVGKTYYLTYTMSVNDSYDFTKTTIGNEFNSFMDGFKNGEGMFYWGGPVPPGDGSGNSKWHKNASVPKTITAPWNSAPYGGDVVLYSALIKNDTDEDWNGENIVFEDTFTEELQRHDGTSMLNQDCLDCDKLNFSSPFNLAALNNGVGVSVKTTTGQVTTVSSSVSNFDPSKVSVIDTDPNDNKFSVNLGAGNVIKSKEQVVLVYTLQVKPNVNPKDETGTKVNTFTNSGIISYDNNIKGTVSDVWNVNPLENLSGVVDMLKSTTGVSTNHSVSRLENDDVVSYKVSLSNNHIKANRYISFQSIIDALPSNLNYVDNSFKLKFYKTEYATSNDPNNPTTGTGVKTELPLPTGADQYTLSYVDTNSDGKKDSIKVEWPSAIELTSGGYVDNTFSKIQTFSYEFEYDAKVDTTGMLESEGTKQQTNKVQIFTINPSSELSKKNGTIGNDTNNLDGNADTKAYIEASNNVTILNNNFNYGNLAKSVTSGNATFNIAGTNVGRDYKIVINNTGARDYTISKFIDILPIYEKYRAGTLKINGTLIDESDLTIGTFASSQSQSVLNEKITYTKDTVVPANSKIEITYSTDVNKDDVRAKMIETQNNTIPSLVNMFAFYMKDNANLTLAGGGSAFADGEVELENNWDNDINTKYRYQSNTGVSYLDNSIVPAVDIVPLIVLDSGKTQQYIQNITPINPGDSVAWNIKVGNANNSTANILNGSKILLVLPEGVTFDKDNIDNQYLDANGATTKPAYLSDPEVSINSNNQQVISWTVTQDIGKTNLGFTIKTATKPYKYTSYAPEVYFVPLQQDNQSFYSNMLNAGNNNLKTAWPGYKEVYEDISSNFSTLPGETHLVKDSSFVDVYGAYGLSAYKKVSANGKEVTSRDSDRVLTLNAKSDIFKYTLRIESVKSDTRIANLVFIDRLPSIGDIAVITDSKRDSQTPVRLQGDGNLVIKYKETNTSTEQILSSSQYRLEYFFGASNEVFSEQDKNGIEQAGRWLSKTEVESDTTLDYNKVTAIRIVITDPTVIVGQMGEIEATFDAHLGEKTQDYTKAGAVGVNNFGYKLEFGLAQNILKSEVVSVGVNSDVLKAKATINKNVDLANHTDAKTRAYFESILENRKFNFTLIGKDENNVEKYSQELTIDTTTTTTDGYSGSTIIENLDPSYKYTLVEEENPNFKQEIDLVANEVNDQMQYTFTVTNTWNPIKLQVDKEWLDVDGNIINQTDIQTLLGSFVPFDVDVDLYNTANVNINYGTGEIVAKDDLANESTLPIDQLLIKKGSINLSTLQIDFGYLNQYNKIGNKINYGVIETANTLNYDAFSRSYNYTETTVDNNITGNFKIQNQIGSGSVELTKKDDLGNTLENVEFTLEDPLGNETTHFTDTNGKISLTKLNPGEYKFVEKTTLPGYIKDSNAHSFTIEANATESVKLEVINPIIKGSIVLVKKDDLGNVLENATFELYDTNDNLITTKTSDANGKITFDNLVPKDYYLKETNAPTGYTKIQNLVNVTLPHNPSAAIELEVINPIIKGSVELSKKDDLGNYLANAQFELYNENNELLDTKTSGNDGKITIDNLVPGNYYFKEVSAPVGYVKVNNNIEFTIAHNPSTVAQVEVVNPIIKGSVSLTKKDDLGNVLENATFELYDSNNNLITTKTSDVNGNITIDNLIPNNYYFKEKDAPIGYTKDATNINFTIKHNPSEVETVESINPIIKGSVELTLMNEFDVILPNGQFELYTKDNVKLYDNLVSDENGKIIIDNLIPGEYYFKEVKAPDNYLMMPEEKDRNYAFTIEFNPTSIQKVNAYNYSPVNISPNVTKNVLGSNPDKDTFKFEMKSLNGAPMPEASQDNIKYVDAKTGKVDFNNISYDKAGKYSYLIKEIAGKNKYFTYDKTVYQMDVEVKFDGRALKTLITYTKNNGLQKVNQITFTNKYYKPNDIPDGGVNDAFYTLIIVMLGVSLSVINFNYRKQ